MKTATIKFATIRGEACVSIDSLVSYLQAEIADLQGHVGDPAYKDEELKVVASAFLTLVEMLQSGGRDLLR